MVIYAYQDAEVQAKIAKTLLTDLDAAEDVGRGPDLEHEMRRRSALPACLHPSLVGWVYPGSAVL